MKKQGLHDSKRCKTYDSSNLWLIWGTFEAVVNCVHSVKGIHQGGEMDNGIYQNINDVDDEDDIEIVVNYSSISNCGGVNYQNFIFPPPTSIYYHPPIYWKFWKFPTLPNSCQHPNWK